MQKECKVHGISNHFKRKDTVSSYRCRQCASKSVTKRRRKIKEYLVNMFGGKCVRCGYDKHMAALEFHHPESKSFGIAAKGYSRAFSKAIIEAKKCELICANCHRETTY